MTFVSTIGQAPAPASSANSLGGLDSQAFLRLLVAQMRYQDPMAPSDPSAMLQQTASFTQVETMQRLVATQQQMLGLSHVTIAADLVGKEVVAQNADGTQITGRVDAVRFTADGPRLVIGEHIVPMDGTVEIRQPQSETG